MRQRLWDRVLYALAEDQAGYFTASQARAAGLHQVRLVQLHARGDVVRVTRGVYRFVRYPSTAFSHFMEAVLWPQVRRPGALAVISHESALEIHDSPNVNRLKIHVTVPVALRIRRDVPSHLMIHRANLGPNDVQRVGGIPVTSPARTIRDLAPRLSPRLLGQTILDGRRSGAMTLAETDPLAAELLPGRRSSVSMESALNAGRRAADSPSLPEPRDNGGSRG